jgi:hypothetical protein
MYVSQAAGVRTTGFAPAARMSTLPSAPLATCGTATSPGQQITRYITAFASLYSCCLLSRVYLQVLPHVASAFAFTACCCCLPFRRPCKSLCKLRPTTPHQGVTWAQGRLRRCTLVGVLPRMARPCLMDLQCRRAMAFLSSLGVRRIHMDMVVAYRWGTSTGQCKWQGHLHILVDL